MTPSGAYRHAHVAQGPSSTRMIPCVITVISQLAKARPMEEPSECHGFC